MTQIGFMIKEADQPNVEKILDFAKDNLDNEQLLVKMAANPEIKAAAEQMKKLLQTAGQGVESDEEMPNDMGLEEGALGDAWLKLSVAVANGAESLGGALQKTVGLNPKMAALGAGLLAMTVASSDPQQAQAIMKLALAASSGDGSTFLEQASDIAVDMTAESKQPLEDTVMEAVMDLLDEEYFDEAVGDTTQKVESLVRNLLTRLKNNPSEFLKAVEQAKNGSIPITGFDNMSDELKQLALKKFNNAARTKEFLATQVAQMVKQEKKPPEQVAQQILKVVAPEKASDEKTVKALAQTVEPDASKIATDVDLSYAEKTYGSALKLLNLSEPKIKVVYKLIAVGKLLTDKGIEDLKAQRAKEQLQENFLKRLQNFKNLINPPLIGGEVFVVNAQKFFNKDEMALVMSFTAEEIKSINDTISKVNDQLANKPEVKANAANVVAAVADKATQGKTPEQKKAAVEPVADKLEVEEPEVIEKAKEIITGQPEEEPQSQEKEKTEPETGASKKEDAVKVDGLVDALDKFMGTPAGNKPNFYYPRTNLLKEQGEMLLKLYSKIRVLLDLPTIEFHRALLAYNDLNTGPEQGKKDPAQPASKPEPSPETAQVDATGPGKRDDLYEAKDISAKEVQPKNLVILRDYIQEALTTVQIYMKVAEEGQRGSKELYSKYGSVLGTAAYEPKKVLYQINLKNIVNLCNSFLTRLDAEMKASTGEQASEINEAKTTPFAEIVQQVKGVFNFVVTEGTQLKKMIIDHADKAELEEQDEQDENNQTDGKDVTRVKPSVDAIRISGQQIHDQLKSIQEHFPLVNPFDSEEYGTQGFENAIAALKNAMSEVVNVSGQVSKAPTFGEVSGAAKKALYDVLERTVKTIKDTFAGQFSERPAANEKASEDDFSQDGPSVSTEPIDIDVGNEPEVSDDPSDVDELSLEQAMNQEKLPEDLQELMLSAKELLDKHYFFYELVVDTFYAKTDDGDLNPYQVKNTIDAIKNGSSGIVRKDQTTLDVNSRSQKQSDINREKIEQRIISQLSSGMAALKQGPSKIKASMPDWSESLPKNEPSEDTPYDPRASPFVDIPKDHDWADDEKVDYLNETEASSENEESRQTLREKMSDFISNYQSLDIITTPEKVLEWKKEGYYGVNSLLRTSITKLTASAKQLHDMIKKNSEVLEKATSAKKDQEGEKSQDEIEGPQEPTDSDLDKIEKAVTRGIEDNPDIIDDIQEAPPEQQEQQFEKATQDITNIVAKDVGLDVENPEVKNKIERELEAMAGVNTTDSTEPETEPQTTSYDIPENQKQAIKQRYLKAPGKSNNVDGFFTPNLPKFINFLGDLKFGLEEGSEKDHRSPEKSIIPKMAKGFEFDKNKALEKYKASKDKEILRVFFQMYSGGAWGQLKPIWDSIQKKESQKNAAIGGEEGEKELKPAAEALINKLKPIIREMMRGQNG